MHKLPFPSPSISSPSLSTNEGLTPKNGRVADPGFLEVIPAIGEISTEPVSVCHQVSITSHFDLPTFLKYHSHTSGFIGSPTVPSTLKDARL